MGGAARRMAICSMVVAFSVVLMLLGAVLELGMYACPMLVGLCFIPAGQKFGRRYHLLLYAATGVLCFLLVPNVEENLMLAGLFGWYPVVRSVLQRLPLLLRWGAKLLLFNAVVIVLEWLVMTILAPEVMADPLLWILLVLGNITFIAYDLAIPRAEMLLERFIKRTRR